MHMQTLRPTTRCLHIPFPLREQNKNFVTTICMADINFFLLPWRFRFAVKYIIMISSFLKILTIRDIANSSIWRLMRTWWFLSINCRDVIIYAGRKFAHTLNNDLGRWLNANRKMQKKNYNNKKNANRNGQDVVAILWEGVKVIKREVGGGNQLEKWD